MTNDSLTDAYTGNNRSNGLALIAGSFASIITMAFHPTGHDLFASGHPEAISQLNVAVHSLALISLPVMFFGACGLSRRLAAAGQIAFAALITYAFALLAVMNAAVASGLIAPKLASRILDPDSDGNDVWKIVFHYNGEVNQAFALVFVVASSVAIVLWSTAMLRSGTLSRGMAIYGCILGPITVLGVLAGHVRLDVHGFGIIILGQTIWFVTIGVLLCRQRSV